MANEAARNRKQITAPYRNRILQTAMVPAGQLLANPANPFLHSHEQETVLDAMLREVGFIAHVVVNRRTDKSWGRDRGVDTIVDGHLRVQAALSRGGEEQDVPVAYIDVTRNEENALLASVNPIAMMTGTDREKLDALVAELPDDLQELTAVLRAEQKALKHLVEFEAVDESLHTDYCCPKCGYEWSGSPTAGRSTNGQTSS